MLWKGCTHILCRKCLWDSAVGVRVLHIESVTSMWLEKSNCKSGIFCEYPNQGPTPVGYRLGIILSDRPGSRAISLQYVFSLNRLNHTLHHNTPPPPQSSWLPPPSSSCCAIFYVANSSLAPVVTCDQSNAIQLLIRTPEVHISKNLHLFTLYKKTVLFSLSF